MASCHSITYVNEEMIGDPLEIKMFESTDWKLNETDLPRDVLVSVRPSIES